MAEVRKEYPKYFEALEQHPRLLVGTEVPALRGEGTETLKDSADAKEWQEAIKSLLMAEVNDRTNKAMEGSSGYLETLHQSIQLFQDNLDLIPGTKGFDVDLANRLTDLLKPYEVRDEESKKLHGYSIPVQPIVTQLRTQLTAERAKAPAAPSPVAGAAAPAGGAAAVAEPPQAGITSKAGNSGEAEDFSTLFGTLGLPDLRI